jgi:hypothetical protein
MEVSGTIKLQGASLRGGLIEFEPLDGQDTKSGSVIAGGQYQVPRPQGLKPGKYRVRITSGDGKTPANPEDIAGPSTTNIVSRDRIPPEWNTRSTKEVSVNKKGPNKFDFEIPAR